MPKTCMCSDISKICKKQTTTCFGNIWLFNNFNKEQFDLLKSIGRQRTLKKGEIIFSQGDTPKELFLVKGGRIKLTKYFDHGRELTLDLRKCGELFGEDILGSTEKYPVSAMAIENTVTCGVYKKDIEKLILEHREIGLVIIKNMSNRISSLSSRLENMSILNIQDRLYNLLLNIAKDHGVKKSNGYLINFNLTHEDLGFLVNGHRVSVTKGINNLISLNKIVLENKEIFIPFDTPQTVT